MGKLNGINPLRFDNKDIAWQENTMWHHFQIRIKKISEAEWLSNDVQRQKQEFILGVDKPHPHCLYLKEWSQSKKTLKCMNSWGENSPYPVIKLGNISQIWEVYIVIIQL